MFNFFKNQNTKKTADEQVQAVLNKTMLYHQPFMSYVEKSEISNKTLTLQMRICQTDDTAELEKVYQNLQQQLYPLGIEEVNINVTVLARDDLAGKAVGNKTVQPSPSKQAVQTHRPIAGTPKSIDADKAEPIAQASKQSQLQPHPRIAHIIVVASGKGGVGKSTTTVNLALALQHLGKRVGVLDADIYGPSIPTMLGVDTIRPVVENEQFVPIEASGLAVLSIGNLIESENTPIAWRGIKATGALMQLYNQANWPQLDYLLIDMPPGTGDIQLTLAQRIPVTGALIVTTPQHIALLDAKKGVEMFYKTDIPVLGIIENMALHTCSSCGHSEAIFGAGGGDKIAQIYGVPLLGQLPLDGHIRALMDDGAVSALQNAAFAKHYQKIAMAVEERAAQFTKKSSNRFF